jgi:transposase
VAGEVLSGPERRRRWSAEEKAKLVAEMTLPGASVTEMSRRYGISRSLLHAWRREANQGTTSKGATPALPELVPIMITDGAEPPKPPLAVPARSSVGAKPTGTIEIVLPGGVHVTVRGRIEERMLRAVLGALRSV